MTMRWSLNRCPSISALALKIPLSNLDFLFDLDGIGVRNCLRRVSKSWAVLIQSSDATNHQEGVVVGRVKDDRRVWVVGKIEGGVELGFDESLLKSTQPQRICGQSRIENQTKKIGSEQPRTEKNESNKAESPSTN